MIGCNFFKGKNLWQSKLKCANVISKNILLVSSLNIYISLNWLFLGIQKIPMYWVWTIPRYNQPYLQKYKDRYEYIHKHTHAHTHTHTYIFTTREAILQSSSSKITGGFPDGTVVKNPPANAGCGSIPGSGRSFGGNGNPFQYSCLGNPMHRGTCWATVQRVAKSLDMTKHKIKVLKPI